MPSEELQSAPARPARTLPFPGWWQGIAILFVVLFLQVVMGGAIGVLIALGADVTGEEVGEVLGHPGLTALINTVTLGSILWVAPILFVRASWAEIYPLRRVALAAILLTPPTLLGIGILGSEVDNFVRSVLPMPEAVAALFERLVGSDALYSFLALVVVAPLTEELLFRGLVLRGFLLRYGSWAAIWAQALLFALFHANPWQFASPLALGVLFGWLALRTGSLVLPILGHAVNNSLVWGLQVSGLQVKGLAGDISGPVEFQPLWLDLTGLALVALGVVALQRVFRRGDATESPAPA